MCVGVCVCVCVWLDVVWKRSEVKSATVNNWIARATRNFSRPGKLHLVFTILIIQI